MALILIEGPDNSGKTTLARALEDRGFHYVHNGVPPPGDLFAEYGYQIVRSAMGHFRDVVIDRLHFSEYVYGQAMRGNSRLTLKQLDLLTSLLQELAGKVVLCTAPFDRIRELWEERRAREYVGDEDRLRQVFLGYQALGRMMKGAPWLVEYDWTRHEGKGKVEAFAREVAAK